MADSIDSHLNNLPPLWILAVRKFTYAPPFPNTVDENDIVQIKFGPVAKEKDVSPPASFDYFGGDVFCIFWYDLSLNEFPSHYTESMEV